MRKKQIILIAITSLVNLWSCGPHSNTRPASSSIKALIPEGEVYPIPVYPLCDRIKNNKRDGKGVLSQFVHKWGRIDFRSIVACTKKPDRIYFEGIVLPHQPRKPLFILYGPYVNFEHKSATVHFTLPNLTFMCSISAARQVKYMRSLPKHLKGQTNLYLNEKKISEVCPPELTVMFDIIDSKGHREIWRPFILQGKYVKEARTYSYTFYSGIFSNRTFKGVEFRIRLLRQRRGGGGENVPEIRPKNPADFTLMMLLDGPITFQWNSEQ